MTKPEVKAKLEAAGYNRSSNREVWDECFKLVMAETHVRLKHGCGGCYNRCREWLEKA